MLKNGKVEICGMNKGKWIRVKGTVKEDVRREARVAMMEENTASLSSMYSVDDNLMTVLYFENSIGFRGCCILQCPLLHKMHRICIKSRFIQKNSNKNTKKCCILRIMEL